MPVSLDELISFFVLCLVLALVPGANLAIVLRNTARGGLPAAWATAAGLTISKVAWAAASLVGLASLLSTSANAWSALRLAGAAYLIYLGLTTVFGARREMGTDTMAKPRPGISALHAARSGAVSDLLNPKVGAFYLAVFPQFIGPGDPVALTGAVLLVVHATILMSYYPLVAALALRSARFIRRRVRVLGEMALGTVLVGMGAFVALDARR